MTGNSPSRSVFSHRVLLPVVLTLAFACESTAASQIWVSRSGDDSNAGSREKPFATIPRGLQALKPGMTLNVAPGETPWPGDIRIAVGGTEEAPIVVDGHGSVVSGRRRLPPEAWRPEGGDVYSRKLPNNAWGMDRHWEGGFPLVWFDGVPGKNAASRRRLKPNGYFLYKNRKEQRTDPLHNTLYIRLPSGTQPSASLVESIAGEGGIFVGGDHVTVRNFVTEYGGRDGYATSRNRGVVFENIEARHFMDQGMSHHGAEAVIRRAHFRHNAGAGVVDVYPECRTRYENCLIELDTWRGGVEFHKGEFEMANCVIRANPHKALTVTKGARVRLRNCVLIGGDGDGGLGVNVGDGGRLAMSQCTLIGFRTGLSAALDRAARVTLNGCRFVRCESPMRVVLRHDHGKAAPDPKERFVVKDVLSDGGEIEIVRKTQAADLKWRVRSETFTVGDEEASARYFGSGIGRIQALEDIVARHAGDWPLDRLDEFVR